MQSILERAFLTRQNTVDQHEAGNRLEVVFDQIDTARNGGPVKPFGDQHDQQQAPPKNRHRKAGDGNPHQRLVIPAAAFHGRCRASWNADQHREQHGGKRQFNCCRKQSKELGENFFIGDDGGAKVAVQKGPDIVEELFPNGLIQSEILAEFGKPLRADPTLPYPHLDRIARHQADRDKGDEHQCDERRHGQG